MTSLEHGRFCDEVVNQTGLLVVTLEGADLSANVPTTPDWDLSDLVRHIGGNLRSLETQLVGMFVPQETSATRYVFTE